MGDTLDYESFAKQHVHSSAAYDPAQNGGMIVHALGCSIKKATDLSKRVPEEERKRDRALT
jgi:hypothetical protein